MIIRKNKSILIVFLSMITFGQISAQQTKDVLQTSISITTNQPKSINEIILLLKSQPEINLSFNKEDIDMEKPISLKSNKEDWPTQELLDIVAKEAGLTYKVIGKQIVLKKKVTSGDKHSVSGYIKDSSTGEPLIGVLIILNGTTGVGTSTNLYGFYSISLPEGEHSVSISYLGYETATKQISLFEDQSLTFELKEAVDKLEEVIITDRRIDENVTATRMGTERLSTKQIGKIPVLFGETDLIKAIKLLPGVQMTGETSSGFSVRGGNFDQNLILLDEATVYNPSHLLGLFSTFNNDAINNVNFYKGVFPAKYGGRVSSVVDVRMKEGNSKQISGQGGISLISSRLTLEAPIVKNKGSIILSGRRTYADLAYRAFKKGKQDVALYFYDFNGKANYMLNDKNKIFLSSYTGRDVLELGDPTQSPSFDWGNITTTARWNHVYNSGLFSNLSLIYSKYDYKLGFGAQDFSFDWKSILKDYSVKMDFDYYANASNSLSFGFSSTLHTIDPGDVTLKSKDESGSLHLPENNTLEHAVYIGNEQKITSKFTLDYGIRFTLLQNIGKTKAFKFDENFEFTDSVNYKKGEIYNVYYGLEPRISGNYLISHNQSVKFGYSRTQQFLHLASNSISGTPLDIWIPSSPNIKPQIANQVTVGYFRNAFGNKLELSTELYYKYLTNQIDFKDHADLFLNEQLEGELRFGTARAYGLEFKLSKPKGKLNGWISYTLSRSERKFKDIASGKPYLSPFDRTHNVSVVGNYDLSKRISISGNWVYFNGLPFTAPSGRFVYGNSIVPSYTKRNGDRLPDYHRLDIGVTINNKVKPGSRLKSSWNVSVYNVYNRKNANVVRFASNENDTLTTEATKTSIFPIIPTISWNFEF
ncbi:MAG: TonB-dependent receptor [Cyclobacteriaceae bacterium]